jgi:co-chaperonin GroES (HSP10)
LSEIADAQSKGVDPKRAHLDAVGDYSGYECFHNRLLVCTYVRPNKTAGGIILSDQSTKEDRFQSRCGLVLKLGPTAFVDDNVVKFGKIGRTKTGKYRKGSIREGDWVVFSPANGREIFFVDKKGHGMSCRIIEDSFIDGRIDDPSKLY